MHDNKKYCPVCSSEMTETEYFSKIFKQNNFYCPHCDSYHITDEIDTSDYYAHEYHADFKYGNLPKIFRKLRITGNRAVARFLYFKNHVDIKKNLRILEIGGGKGDNFTVFDKNNIAQLYTIVEPNAEYNLKHKNLEYINDMIEDVDIEKLRNTHSLIMFHVLEHIYDLKAFFELQKNINPKYFYFEVPNCNIEQVRIDSLLNHPHYHHFSKKSLEILAKNKGMNILRLDIIEPVSYHPFKKIAKFKKYFSRINRKHEIFDNEGIYLRGIFTQNN